MEQEVNEVTTKEGEAPHFVLIHGACHDAWCWYKLRCLMESAGYHTTCVDLGTSGIHPSDANSIFSFDEYNKPSSISWPPCPSIKSAGGHSVTQLIHLFPHKIKAAVFVAAAMLRFGFLTPDDVKHGKPNFSEYGGDVYIYQYGLGVDQPPTSVLFNEKYLREIFYNMSPLEDMTLARMLLRPCPIRALSNAKFVIEGVGDAWERVPRVYIKTRHDHTLKSELQDGMIEWWPPSQVYEIDSDHSPFFSNPSALFHLLVQVANCYGF